MTGQDSAHGYFSIYAEVRCGGQGLGCGVDSGVVYDVVYGVIYGVWCNLWCSLAYWCLLQSCKNKDDVLL